MALHVSRLRSCENGLTRFSRVVVDLLDVYDQFKVAVFDGARKVTVVCHSRSPIYSLSLIRVKHQNIFCFRLIYQIIKTLRLRQVV